MVYHISDFTFYYHLESWPFYNKKFEGDVKYAKLDMLEMEHNIPDDLHMGVRSKSVSLAIIIIVLINKCN